MVLNRLSEAGGRGAGGFLGGILNNPGTVAILAIVAALILFRNDIRSAFASIPEAIGNIGNVQLPDITFPTFEFPTIELPAFPEITFPEFPQIPTPDFSFLEGIFSTTPPPVPIPPPPGVIETEGLGPVTTPEGCTVDELGRISCPTPPTFDVCNVFPELCETTPTPEPITPPITPTFPGEPQLPPGFEGGGISFEGGTIRPRDPCFMTLNEIIEAGLASSASAAANLKAIACSQNVTQEPSDFPTSFDFGTNIPGPTTESEAKRAACTSCELFGLNCPICRGELTNGFA